ncbi:hypothetical protein K439DRAFT_1406803 [Ramaria rubella]|nr:hypothetical protein K439DRAFT_1406803 [Ramaria rubella]
MQLPSLSVVLLSAAAFVGAAQLSARQQGFCPEAARFGSVAVTPSSLQPGDSFTVLANFSCSVSRGIIPKFIDYYIEVPEAVNNGHEPPILVARRDFALVSGQAPIDQFTTTLPHAFFFEGAAYGLSMTITYPINGTDGSEVFIAGGLSAGLNITSS